MKFSVIGGGLFGTALAKILASNGHDVLMWNIFEEEVISINNLNIHPNIGYSERISSRIKSTSDIQKVIQYSEYIILSVPSYVLGEAIEKFKPYLGNDKKFFINTAKGFHPQSFKTVTDFIYGEIPKKNIAFVGSIVGPTFAVELLNEQITMANILSKNMDYGRKIAQYFQNNYFKLIPWCDVQGGEFLSSYKNVIAVGAGLLHGYDFQIDSYAILMTKAINEAKCLLEHLGYNSNTIYQLCGIGDMILTCGSKKSRNFQSGVKIAELNSVSDTILQLKELNITVEGIGNASIIKSIIDDYRIDWNTIPITKGIIQILQSKCNIKNTLKQMLLS